MNLTHIKEDQYRLSYNNKNVIVTLLNDKSIKDKEDLYFNLYDLIQDTLYLEIIEDLEQYNNIEDLNRMKKNKDNIEKMFSIDEIEDLENEIDNLEYSL